MDEEEEGKGEMVQGERDIYRERDIEREKDELAGDTNNTTSNSSSSASCRGRRRRGGEEWREGEEREEAGGFLGIWCRASSAIPEYALIGSYF